MNVNKKLDRLKQWAGERMGGEVKTNVSDDFKALEVEMGLRHDGMKENQRAMTAYVKAMSKRNDLDDRDEKALPVTVLGATMVHHGEDFEHDSEFGRCLIAMGQTNERIGRIQEGYIANATSSWLESLERSLAQMKEYQAARKKLENRRLAYDAALAKMQKAKKEDFRVEEELRSQKAKYEETSEDVYRRMQDIKEAEVDSVEDLTAFLEAELSYHDRCREALVQLKRDWPAKKRDSGNRKLSRSRSNTAHSYADRYNAVEDEVEIAPPERPSIRSTRAVSSQTSIRASDDRLIRPNYGRPTTFEGPTQLHRDGSPMSAQRMARAPSDSLVLRPQQLRLQPVSRSVSDSDAAEDPSDAAVFYENGTSSPASYYRERSASPAISTGSLSSRTGSSTALNTMVSSGRKPPPPPPPSRAKKPPPPPPMKRSALGTSNVQYA